ncbi:MAG: hypothetical protein RL291_978 [Pseudomonadota bacterium]
MAGQAGAKRGSIGRPARTVAVIFVGVGPLLAGCANEIAPQKLGGPMPQAIAAPAKAAPMLVEQEPLRRGAHSDRVLSAIALERVTGRQPAANRLLPQR